MSIPADIVADADLVTDPKAVEAARRVAAMDPPSRAAAAAAMAVRGASYPEIARVLDYPGVEAAKHAVWSAIGDIETDPDDVKRQRALMGAGLDRMLSSCMGRATNPKDPDHLAYVRVVLAIYDRKARLHGLDAPTSVVLHTPTQREIDDYVAQVRRLQLVAAGDVEADIIEGEVVHDDVDRAAS